MSSVCTTAVSCIDARVPVRASYVSLYKWPESDAEFMRRRREGGGDQLDNYPAKQRIKFGPSPIVVDSYSCRQMYLRSYRFTRKETVQEKTRRCLGKVKEKAAVFSSQLGREQRNNEGIKNKRKNKRTNKVKEGYVYSAICSIFHRILSCTTSVEVVDR